MEHSETCEQRLPKVHSQVASVELWSLLEGIFDYCIVPNKRPYALTYPGEFRGSRGTFIAYFEGNIPSSGAFSQHYTVYRIGKSAW